MNNFTTTDSAEEQSPVVTIQCYWYEVDFGPAASGQRVHTVGKNRECTCQLKGRCPAVQAVARYLRGGGQRAPEPRPDFWPSVPKACPVCGGQTKPDSALNSARHGKGWQCMNDPYHYWRARYMGIPKGKPIP